MTNAHDRLADGIIERPMNQPFMIDCLSKIVKKSLVVLTDIFDQMSFRLKDLIPGMITVFQMH